MRVSAFWTTGIVALCSLSASPSATTAQSTTTPLAPPVAAKHAKPITVNGDTRVDNYFWLREKSDPEVMKYLHAEDDYAEAVMKPTAAFQESLYKEMLSHLKQTDDTVPYRQGEYFYYSRTREGQQYPTYYRRHGRLDAPDEVLLDVNALAAGKTFMAVGARAVSDDGNWLAYTTDDVGYRQYALHVMDLRTRKLSSEAIPRVGNVMWAADNKTVFYTTEDQVTKRSDKFFRHTVGAPGSDLLYEEKDELFDVFALRTRDKAMILLGAFSKTSTDWRYVPAATPTAALKVIVPRQPDHEYDLDHRAGLFYIRTNKGATNFRVVTAPVATPDESHWKEVIPHRPAVKVEGVDLFANHLVLSEWENGLQQIEIQDLATGARHRVAFPEPIYAAGLSANAEFETKTLRYAYQSLVTPSSIFDYDMTTRKATLLKETEVPGGFNRTNYASERLFATASDGTKIPISIVYRKGMKKDGSAPMLLYAYGSYGSSTSPTFSYSRLALLDRGVTYAIAHIRGGGELGEPWREQGRMMKKMNTFTDFIASAEYLVAEKYTAKDRLVINGGSAGGLLMGAVVNMRPDLFKAVIAQVPFVDVLNTMLDASLPLTTSEYIEWGNPNEKPAYDYMKQYSPYDNVKAQNYPAMLVKVSINDSQVPYWEGAKFVAKIRAMKTDSNPLLLKVNFGAGHGGSSGRYDALRETAFNYAFALTQVGINK
jgi:oligopeptidase B